MGKLLSANFQRLWLNGTFWLMVLVIVGLESIFCLEQEPYPADTLLLFFLQMIGVVIAIFLSLFNGTEYQDGTIRNKIVVGHKRSHVYLANLVTAFAAVTILFLAGVLTGSVLGGLLYEPVQNELGTIVLAGGIGWLACLTFAAIFNLVGMLSASKATTVVICILSAFGLMFYSLSHYQKLIRPGVVTGTKRATYQVLLDLNPSGQMLQAMSYDVDAAGRMILFSSAVVVVCSVIGVFFFGKKDLK